MTAAMNTFRQKVLAFENELNICRGLNNYYVNVSCRLNSPEAFYPLAY